MLSDFPGGPVVKSLPANAGHVSLIPGPGRFHMLRGNKTPASQPLSLCPRTHAPQQGSHRSEKPTHLTQREAPVTPTGERKLAHSKKDPEQPKINK